MDAHRRPGGVPAALEGDFAGRDDGAVQLDVEAHGLAGVALLGDGHVDRERRAFEHPLGGLDPAELEVAAEAFVAQTDGVDRNAARGQLP